MKRGDEFRDPSLTVDSFVVDATTIQREARVPKDLAFLAPGLVICAVLLFLFSFVCDQLNEHAGIKTQFVDTSRV